MTRFTLALLAALAAAAPVAAQEMCSTPCPRGFIEYLTEEYWENHRWPYPYFGPDRQAVRDTFAIMVQNGWRRQNLLAEYHFQGGQLNEAGQAAVRRIVGDFAALHHPIYVRRADGADETAARIAAVQQFAAKIAADGGPPPILETSVSPAGYPAGWPPSREGAVSRKFQVWVPDKMYLSDQDNKSTGAK